ncbi:Dps family protein [Flavisolibacter tropicus]|uniref:DNA polymerase sliding clamp subunit n=1 Tax=Flavisolibacter tropicus TaxID=1492898 RepID=A0A172TT43_9BACT|nr:Dps family protein [Flavisolibacter tropicus]ANE50128.1 DNA polymerase sliding clamp subunit [Flavisolibacter tropicus]
MAKKNWIGLDQTKSKDLAEKLNNLLANYQVFYINVRGLHWNITGDKFFVLHVKFEELYNDLLEKVDEIAERILTLGHTPLHSFTEYLKLSSVKEATNISEGTKAVQTIVDNFGNILSLQREILTAAQDASDEGTNALISDYIRQQEKLVWMYSAYLK